MDSSTSVIGWDIGGVHTKVARSCGGALGCVLERSFELQRQPGALVPLLRDLASEVSRAPGAAASSSTAHAVTMTAELSQMFRTKRAGVSFVLDAVRAAFPREDVRVFAVDGSFLTIEQARDTPLTVAAANWSATARLVAERYPNAVVLDVGSTTTDVIPIVDGRVACQGWTDPERLASGELVYTGATRTPAEAIASHVAIGRRMFNVSAEGFALAADVHVWRGDLSAAHYTAPTPDGRPTSREFAGERLARVVCGDREMLDEPALDQIAGSLALAQVMRIAESIRRLRVRHRALDVAVVTGVGAFLASAAARAVGMNVIELASEVGADAARCAPAAAVALLFERTGLGDAASSSARASSVARPPDPPPSSAEPAATLPSVEPRVEVIVKVGGALMKDPDLLAAAVAAVDALRREHRLLVVPGGGPFADAVREADRRLCLGDRVAHWLAIAAMDQYAHLLASRVPDGVLVTTEAEIAAALDAGRLTVLAPSHWLREADPLPHSWEVTSDSIAAWLAGRLGAPRLVLIKPPGSERRDPAGVAAHTYPSAPLVDAYFARALPASVTALAVAADQVGRLPALLRQDIEGV